MSLSMLVGCYFGPVLKKHTNFPASQRAGERRQVKFIEGIHEFGNVITRWVEFVE